MDRKQIATIYFQNKKENIGEDAWDVSEQQNGSVMAWIKWGIYRSESVYCCKWACYSKQKL